MKQVVRNLTSFEDGFSTTSVIFIMDRDRIFCNFIPRNVDGRKREVPAFSRQIARIEILIRTISQKHSR